MFWVQRISQNQTGQTPLCQTVSDLSSCWSADPELSSIAALGAWVILDIHFSGTIVVIVIRVPLGVLVSLMLWCHIMFGGKINTM